MRQVFRRGGPGPGAVAAAPAWLNITVALLPETTLTRKKSALVALLRWARYHANDRVIVPVGNAISGDCADVVPPSTSKAPADVPAAAPVTRSLLPDAVRAELQCDPRGGSFGVTTRPSPRGGGVGAQRVDRPARRGLEVVREDRGARRRGSAVGDVQHRFGDPVPAPVTTPVVAFADELVAHLGAGSGSGSPPAPAPPRRPRAGSPSTCR